MTPKDMALCSVFAVALPVGQMMFKWAALYNAKLSGPIVMRVITNYPLIGAFAWYGVTALFWFYVLTRVPLSSAYAFSLAGSCLVPIMAWLVFKEQPSWHMAAGYVLMFAGLALIMAPRAA